MSNWEVFLRKNYKKLAQMGISLNEINTVKFHPKELFTHRLVKFLISHHIFELNHFFKTEQSINNAVCDVIDLSTMVVYEIESDIARGKSKKKLMQYDHPYIEDLFIVDVRKLDCDWLSIRKLSDEIKLHCGLC